MIRTDVFSKIIDGKIKSDIVYKDKYVTAFNDIKPKSPVHILIIPNVFIKNMNHVNDDHLFILGKLLLVASKIAYIKKINKFGYRIVINCNKHGGQEINYLHLHLLGGCYLGNFLN